VFPGDESGKVVYRVEIRFWGDSTNNAGSLLLSNLDSHGELFWYKRVERVGKYERL
jgi:hypothetical protein